MSFSSSFLSTGFIFAALSAAVLFSSALSLWKVGPCAKICSSRINLYFYGTVMSHEENSCVRF